MNAAKLNAELCFKLGFLRAVSRLTACAPFAERWGVEGDWGFLAVLAPSHLSGHGFKPFPANIFITFLFEMSIALQ